MCFRSSRLSASLLIVVSDRFSRAFNRSGATRAEVLDIFKVVYKVWHASLFHKLRSYGISDQVVSLISLFLSNRRLHVVLDAKSLLESPVNTAVSEEFILAPTLFALYLNGLPNVICSIAFYADDTTF